MGDMIDTRQVDVELRTAARRAVNRALYHGTLARPVACDVCGKVPGKAKNGKSLIDAHHRNGYDEAHQLDVEWLCQSCHQRRHARRHGIAHTEVIKQRIGQSLKEAYISGKRSAQAQARMGELNSFWGKTHTPEVRQRISESRKNHG